MVEMMNKFGNI